MLIIVIAINYKLDVGQLPHISFPQQIRHPINKSNAAISKDKIVLIPRDTNDNIHIPYISNYSTDKFT